MPLVIDATVGGANANSYATVADVDAVAPFRGAAGAAWLAGTTTADQQTTALVQATNRLDQLHPVGSRATDTQARLFPRNDVTTWDGAPVPSDVIPDAWKRANISLALAYVTAIVAGADPIATAAERDAKRYKAGDVEVEYFAPTPNKTGDTGAVNDVSDLPADVIRDVTPFLTTITTTDAPYWGSACALRAS